MSILSALTISTPYIVAIMAYAVMEALWLFAMRGFYSSQFAMFTVGGVLRIQSIIAIVLVYPLILGSMFVILHGRTHLAPLFGLAVYGVYNLTNRATIPGYTWTMVAVDTLWGCVVLGTTAAIFRAMSNRKQPVAPSRIVNN